jgi:hypothetical protein
MATLNHHVNERDLLHKATATIHIHRSLRHRFLFGIGKRVTVLGLTLMGFGCIEEEDAD